MLYKIQWASLALRDLIEIRDFIHQDKPVAAKQEAKRIKNSVERLARFPHSGKIFKNIPQVFQLISGNYHIFYRVIDLRVIILRVYHGKRLFEQ